MTRVGKHGSNVGHATTVVVPELRSQTTIEAIWTQASLSYRVTTRRKCLDLATSRSTLLRWRYSLLSKSGSSSRGQLDARQARYEGKSDSGYDEKNRGSCLETPGENSHNDQRQQRLQGHGHASHSACCCRSARCTKPDQHVPKLRLSINPISADLVRVMRQGASRSTSSG